MSGKVFFDTNILLYAHDGRDPKKQRRALDLILAHGNNIVISTQVLQEFFVGATGKLGIPDLETKEIIGAWSRFEVIGIDSKRINEAIDIRILNRISFWDALILSAASSANCTTLLTEDLNDGQIIAGVRVSNPFTGRNRK